MFKSFYQMYEYMRQCYAARTAFQWVDDDGKTLKRKTYTEFTADVYRFAGALRAAVPNAVGAHFGILASNSYHYAVCIGGILCAGGVVTPLNQMETKDIICGQISFADVACVFADEENMERIAPYCAASGIFLLPIEAYHTQPESTIFDRGDESSRLAVLIFTSGSSGKSKCVMLSAGNLFDAIICVVYCSADVGRLPGVNLRRYLLMAPMFHIMPFAAVIGEMCQGVQINCCCSIKELSRDMRLMDSDHTAVVPAVMEAWYIMLARKGKEFLGSISAIMCGGAPTKAEKLQIFENNGIHIIPAYALSETCSAGTYNIFCLTKKGRSVGKLNDPGLQIKIDNGEICFRGKAVMMGYYKDPAATAEAIQDGWLHTGDLGYIDEDGDLFITGRKKNLIILSNGENVSAEELERLLLQNSAVKEALVMEKNDAICALIFCDEGEQAAVSSFVEKLNLTLPMFKQITALEFSSEPLPRTANGKLQRNGAV